MSKPAVIIWIYRGDTIRGMIGEDPGLSTGFVTSEAECCTLWNSPSLQPLDSPCAGRGRLHKEGVGMHLLNLTMG